MSEKVIIIDTETTGLDPLKHRVVEVCVRVGLEEPPEAMEMWRVNPGMPIPAEATATHGIKDEDVVGMPSFGEVADAVASLLERGDVIVGYNVDFDVQMLRQEFHRSGRLVRWPPVVVDCLRLWNIYRPKPKRNLIAAYEQFVDPNGFQGAHGALADTNATAAVLRAQMDALDIRNKLWIDLDPERSTWWGFSDHVLWIEDNLVCNFGKHKGQIWVDVEKGYLHWLQHGKADFPPHVRALAQQTLRALAVKPKLTRVALAQRLHTWARERV